VKIAVAEAPDGRPKQVKIELSSEADLFFMYSHVVDEKTFNAMRDDQKLTVDFATYATILATSFQNAIKVGAGSAAGAVRDLWACLASACGLAPPRVSLVAVGAAVRPLLPPPPLAGAAHLPRRLHHEPRRPGSP